MNYRHAFHAGNFADVLKHFVLVEALSRLTAKESPLGFLDTHAGRGRYPLDDIAMQRGGEFRTGILPVLAAAAPPAALARYIALVRQIGGGDGSLAAYPGSPLMAMGVLREQDRAAFCELEELEADALRAELRGDSRAAVHVRDGYEALGALLPFPEKRGLVLIDPPYEDPLEFDRLARTLVQAHRRWPSGVYAIWFPVTRDGGAARFLARMQSSGVRRQLVAELMLRRPDSPVGLNGAGMLLINPPFRLAEALAEGVRWLADLLAPGEGRARVEVLVDE
jgi:23S rRNA (adenine2030-N6)-methyltransferase